jgi:hypothetical protein
MIPDLVALSATRSTAPSAFEVHREPIDNALGRSRNVMEIY